MMFGELFKGQKEVRANKIWDKADKELRVSYTIDEASTFTFNCGTLVGDYVDCSNINWQILEREVGNLLSSRRVAIETRTLATSV